MEKACQALTKAVSFCKNQDARPRHSLAKRVYCDFTSTRVDKDMHMVRATTGVGPDTDLTVNIYDDLMAPRASGQR